MTDEELTRAALRFREGDEEGLRLLVEQLSRTLIASAYRYTGDWEWARDLTQDTWVRVYERIGQYDGRRPFTGWLRALHRNLCLDHLRRPWVRAGRHTTDLPATLPDRGPSPLRHAERGEMRRRIVAAAATLSETQRRVFALVDLEQRPQREVAAELGVRFTTLRATLHHARRRIAAVLRGAEEAS